MSDVTYAVDAEMIIYRLSEAGRCALSLQMHNISPWKSRPMADAVMQAVKDRPWVSPHLRPAQPRLDSIRRMQDAYGWLEMIPGDRDNIRRVIIARSLVSPVTERHLYSWRRIAQLLRVDPEVVQRWHGQGIAIIVAMLRAEAPREAE